MVKENTNPATPVKRVPKTQIVNTQLKKEGTLAKAWRLAGPDDPSSLKDQIINEVLIPSIKNAIMEACFTAIRGIFNKGQTSTHDRPYTSLNNKYNATPPAYRRDVTTPYGTGSYTPTRTTGIVNELSRITFDTYNDAVRILQELQKDIDTYGWVSVSDFKHMVGVSSTYADSSIGWADTANAQIKSTNQNMYYIRFAEPYRE